MPSTIESTRPSKNCSTSGRDIGAYAVAAIVTAQRLTSRSRGPSPSDGGLLIVCTRSVAPFARCAVATVLRETSVRVGTHRERTEIVHLQQAYRRLLPGAPVTLRSVRLGRRVG